MKENEDIKITPINLSAIKTIYTEQIDLREKIKHSFAKLFEKITDTDADKIINIFSDPNRKSYFLKSLRYDLEKKSDDPDKAVSFLDKFLTEISKSLIKVRQHRQLRKNKTENTEPANPVIKDEIITIEAEETLVEKFKTIKDALFNFASTENTQRELFFKSAVSPLSLELSSSFIIIRENKQDKVTVIEVLLEDKKIYFNKKKVTTANLQYLLTLLKSLASAFNADQLQQEMR